MVVHKNWQNFKDHFARSYRCYKIRKKASATAHGYGTSENHAHETEAHMTTVGTIQTIENATMEDKEAMEKLTSINLTLSQTLPQEREEIMTFSKKLQTLQAQMNSKKPSTNKPATDKKKSINK